MVRIFFIIIALFYSGVSFASGEVKNNSNLKNKDESSMIIFDYINKNNKNKMVELLKTNPNILEVRNSQNQTPLMVAVYNNNKDLAKELILLGANVNAQDNIKNTPFLYAGAEGQLEIVKLSLQHGAKFNIYNRYGGTALIPAAEKGHLEVVKLLANTKGFPIDHVNNLGWTALMEAVVLGDGGKKQYDIIEALLQAGANPNIPDKDGILAVQHARKRGYNAIAELIEKYDPKKQ